jgi:hypothetical protein
MPERKEIKVLLGHGKGNLSDFAISNDLFYVIPIWWNFKVRKCGNYDAIRYALLHNVLRTGVTKLT